MPQYKTYIPNQFNYVTDATTGLRVRFGQRDGKYVDDAEIVVDGFNLAEGVGWQNIKESYAPVVGNRYRIGVRIEAFVIDVETNGTFSGTENNDWENLQESKIE